MRDLSARRRLQFERTPGLLGKQDGTLRTPDGKRYYVREMKSMGNPAPPVALPLLPGTSVLPFPNMAIEIGFDKTGQRVIIGPDINGMVQQGITPMAANPSDPAARGPVRQEEISAFFCRQKKGLPWTAEVFPGTAVFGNTVLKYEGGEIDLTAYVPASGQHCYVTVFISSAGVLSASTSTAQATTSALDQTDLQECLDDAPADGWPLRAFLFDGDSSEASNSSKIAVDVRTLFGPVTDVSQLPEETVPSGGDSVMIYDVSTQRHKRTLISTLLGSAGGGSGSGGGGAAQGALLGLEVDCDGTNVTLQAGEARDGTNSYTLVSTGGITIDPTTTGAGGLDTGSLANNTWYYAYIIAKSADGTTSALLSTSSTAPTMPSGYNRKRRVGAVRTNGSAALYRQFTVRGGGSIRRVYYREDLQGAGSAGFGSILSLANIATHSSWTDVNCASYAPPTARVVIAAVEVVSASASSPIYYRESGVTTQRFVLIAADTGQSAAVVEVPVSSAQVGQVSSGASVTEDFGFAVLGYYDNLLPTISGTSGGEVAITSVTTTYTATTADRLILCNATGGAFTVTLPAAVDSAGQLLHIKKIDASANAVTIDGDGSETIDGATTKSLATQYKAYQIVSDGSAWHIVGMV